MRAIVAAALLTALPACNSQPDFTTYREAIKAKLRDPNSAEFRNEKIRLLWTDKGRRLKIYCAEVNADNFFGGKSGYQPVQVVIEQVGLTDDLWSPGRTIIDEKVNTDYYLNCVRADTQRSDENFGRITLMFGEDPADLANQVEPVLSMKEAPPLPKR